MTPAEHLDRAAWHLYALVKPVDGLDWWALTDAQRNRCRGLIQMSARISDNTAMRAANEGVAKLLALHEDESLRSVPPPVRSMYRARALALTLMWERILTSGTPDSDAKILALITEEAEARVKGRS